MPPTQKAPSPKPGTSWGAEPARSERVESKAPWTASGLAARRTSIRTIFEGSEPAL